MTYGIHHITAISSDPQDTYDFYSHILGLRLLKKTVNQDDTKTYHLFFGDKIGSPGMDLTFFPFKPSSDGKHSAGMVNKIMMSVPHRSMDFWTERIKSFEIKIVRDKNPLGDEYIEFSDWDGQIIQIVETKRINKDSIPWETKDVKADFAIRNFYGAEIEEKNIQSSIKIIEEVLEFEKVKEDPELIIMENKKSDFANLLFIRESQNSDGINSAGTVHHIAFRVKTDQEQMEVREKAIKAGLSPTPVINRFYFKSVYFREPGGVLYEIATDEPGFDVDEDINHLGEKLSLPPFIEDQRTKIESILTEINTDNNYKESAKLHSLFKYFELFNKKKKTIFLLHGTGGDEYDLFGLLSKEIIDTHNIVSLRGNVREEGMNRFFMRFSPGVYDQKSITIESKKLNMFIDSYSNYRNIKKEDIIFLGFSNGANMILTTLSSFPNQFSKILLLHPAFVLDSTKKSDLKHINAFVSLGKFDQMITEEESRQVIDYLQENNSMVVEYDNENGHTITQEEVERIHDFILD